MTRTCGILVLVQTLLFSLVGSGWAMGAGSLDEAAETLATELVSRVDLAGEVVQTAPEFFRSSGGDRVLGFSGLLYESLSAALSRSGVRLSLREQGEEPFRLAGSYQISDERVMITVRLQRLGRTMSSEQAVARAEIERDELPDDMLTDNLATAAAALVASLEQQTVLLSEARFEPCHALPLQQGEPTIRFGTALAQAVTAAVQDSELFGATLLGVVPETFYLVPRYQERGATIALVLELRDARGGVVASSSGEINHALFSPEHFLVFDTRSLPGCISVIGSGRGRVQPDTAQGEALIGTVQRVLGERYGISLRRRCVGQSQRQLLVGLQLTNRRTPDGYVLVSGQIHFEVMDGAGRLLGGSSSRGQSRSTAAGVDISALVETVFDAKMQREVARLVLALAPDDELTTAMDR